MQGPGSSRTLKPVTGAGINGGNELSDALAVALNGAGGKAGDRNSAPGFISGERKPDPLELNPAQISLGPMLGAGAFGQVHLATLFRSPGGPISVAVKLMRSSSARDPGAAAEREIEREIATMKMVGDHPNIIK